MEGSPHTERCSSHAAAVAGWRCASCSTSLCGGCVAAGVHSLPVCTTCGRLVEPLLVPRAVVQPFAKVWPRAVRALAAPLALAQLALVACLLEFLLSLSPPWWLIGRAFELGWLLLLARRAAEGLDPFGAPSYADLGNVWGRPTARLLAGAGLVALAGTWLSGFGQRAVSLQSLWPWVVAAAAVLLLPPSLVAATVLGEVPTPWPWRLGKRLEALGADLLPLCVATALMVVLEAVSAAMAPLSFGDLSFQVHALQALVPRLLGVTALAALGSLAGMLVWVRATELGHGHPEKDLVPRLLEAPSGRWVPQAPDPVAVAEAQARRFAPIELDDPSDAIAAAVARKDVDDALDRLREGHVKPEALQAVLVIELAQLVAGRGDLATAAQLLRGVTARPADEQTPRALVILARLCVEKLGLLAEGQACYQRVLAQFPDSPAARFAAAQQQAVK